MTTLDSLITETSGLLLLHGKLITHNDSGGEPYLFEFDTISGEVTRSVYVDEAKNVDWEDLCADEEYIYIGDIGNNAGRRKDLRIYKIPISEYLKKDTVKPQVINISYGDQKEFGLGNFLTNYDAETLISMGDSLYLFSKNWVNHKTRVYSIAKNPGTYELLPIIEFKAKCLVTSGCYIPETNEMVLCGYKLNKQVVLRISQCNGNDFSNSKLKRKSFKVPENSSKQIEGIEYIKGHQYFVSAESYQNRTQVLYKLSW